MIPAAPYIAIGVFGTIAIVLYIAGCAVTHNWWSLFGILFQIAAIFFFWFFSSRIQEDYQNEESLIDRTFTADSTLFFGVFFQAGAIGLVSVFFHNNTISRDCFIMEFFANVALVIGYIVFVYLITKVDSQVYGE